MSYILIVEDEFDNAEILMYHLAELEIPVQHVPNGYQVVKMVQDNPPLLIFMDVNLPDDDGRVICNQIKNRLKENAPAIIVMTAAYSGVQNRLARQMGADDFASKPLNIPRVIQKARKLLAVRNA